jgi:hypothetical protein
VSISLELVCQIRLYNSALSRLHGRIRSNESLNDSLCLKRIGVGHLPVVVAYLQLAWWWQRHHDRFAEQLAAARLAQTQCTAHTPSVHYVALRLIALLDPSMTAINERKVLSPCHISRCPSRHGDKLTLKVVCRLRRSLCGYLHCWSGLRRRLRCR